MNGNARTKEHLRLLAEIVDAVHSLHAGVVAQRYDYESFGSWSLELRASGSHVRIDFDGRDRVLLGYTVPESGERWAFPSHLVAEQPLAAGLTADTLTTVIAFLERTLAAGVRATQTPRNAV